MDHVAAACRNTNSSGPGIQHDLQNIRTRSVSECPACEGDEIPQSQKTACELSKSKWISKSSSTKLGLDPAYITEGVIHGVSQSIAAASFGTATSFMISRLFHNAAVVRIDLQVQLFIIIGVKEETQHHLIE